MVEPINTKSDENLQLEKLHTDKGTGFTNRLFQRFSKDKNILFFTTHVDRPRQIVLVNCGKVAPKKRKSCSKKPQSC